MTYREAYRNIVKTAGFLGRFKGWLSGLGTKFISKLSPGKQLTYTTLRELRKSRKFPGRRQYDQLKLFVDDIYRSGIQKAINHRGKVIAFSPNIPSNLYKRLNKNLKHFNINDSYATGRFYKNIYKFNESLRRARMRHTPEFLDYISKHMDFRF